MDQVQSVQSILTKAEMLKVGDRVETAVSLPGISSGSVGRIKKIEPLFLVVEFEDGHIGYYSLRQLRRLPPSPEPPAPPPDR